MFRALLVDKPEGNFTARFTELERADLPEGEVLIRVAYSSLNYKDGLALTPDGQVLRRYPCVPGIDLAGTVVESSEPSVAAGQQVLVTGYQLGVAHYGGYSEYACVPAEWVVPLPPGLTPRTAMVYGTAGFTAALALHQLERQGLSPEQGPVLVTGATGGVGSLAVALLAARGYQVVAGTGKADQHDYLRRLGAAEVLSREEVSAPSSRPLEKERWAGAVDPVGGAALAAALRAIRYGGAVASCGLAGGRALETSVLPFILRAVSLLGIDSVMCPMPLRRLLWKQLAGEPLAPDLLELISSEIPFKMLPETAEKILRGEVRGRVVVSIGGDAPAR